MARPTKEQSAHSLLLAAAHRRYLDSLRHHWRLCPATQHLRPDHQQTCSDCIGKVCKAMRAKGLDDAGNPLPPAKRPACGARTRAAGICRHKVIPGKTRCRYHGGQSTGPRTSEGRARIAAAQRNRWARWRRGKRRGNVAQGL